MKKNDVLQKILRTHEMLTDLYGWLDLKPRREPFRELISTKLS